MKKKGFFSGFGAGILTTALVLGLGVSAFAASRTISVDDNIRVTINGAVFSPKDANGKDVALFSYNGTTYAPVRAICEAAGLEVEYDSATYTAVLTTADRVAASDPNSGSYIGVDKAKSIALADAGVNAADAVFLKAKLDRDDGRVEYEVELYSGRREYDYDIDARTGAILSRDWELDDYYLSGTHTGGTGNAGSTSANPDVISAEQAQAIAKAQAPSTATVVKCKLDQDDGRWVYEVELRDGRTEYECDINAVTGVILDWDMDYDD